MSYDQAYEKKAQDLESPGLHAKVFSQFKTYFDDDIVSISAENKMGPFDILRGHANFLSILSTGKLSLKAKDGKQTELNINRGIMHVKNDQIRVFLDV